MPSPATRKLGFAIHHLNPWGGHDRSTLEVVRRLSRQTPVEIFAFQLEDSRIKEWGEYRFHPVTPHVRRPALLMQIIYLLRTTWLLGVLPRLRRETRPLIHATGACSLISDIIQVQFVQAAWKEQLVRLPKDIYRSPSTRSGGILKRCLRGSYNWLIQRFNLWVEKAAYRPRKTYIAIAHCVARELEQYFGIPARQIQVIHHGVDADLFRPADSKPDDSLQADREKIRAELGVGKGELLVIFVGEYERKGLAVSIRALAGLQGTLRQSFKLAAIGGGDARGFISLAAELGLKDRVICLGHQKQIERYYRAADVFLLPTLYEPFGLVILEALASGLPSIVSRLAGGSELINDKVSGWLLDNPAEPAEVTAALEWMISHPERRREMGKEARKVAEQRSWDQVAREYWSLLRPHLERTE